MAMTIGKPLESFFIWTGSSTSRYEKLARRRSPSDE